MKKNDDGFTLIELLLAVAIMGMLFSVISMLVSMSLKTASEAKTRTSTAHDAEFISSHFADDVSSAQSVAPVGIVQFNVEDFDSTVTPPSVVNRTVIYRMQGTELHRVVGAHDITLARDVQSASFNATTWVLTVTPLKPADNPAYTITGSRRSS